MKSARTYRWALISMIAATTGWLLLLGVFAVDTERWANYLPFSNEIWNEVRDRVHYATAGMMVIAGIAISFHLRAIRIDLNALRGSKSNEPN